MSTSIYNPQPARKTSTPSRHRRSTISLHSTPGLGLIRTISRDLVTGWHTTTALQKETSDSSPSVQPRKTYKPKHAARDAMKGFPAAISCDTQGKECVKDDNRRTRQDSVVPSPNEIDGSKPSCFGKEGLVPDHSSDTWTAIWDTAYETRLNTYHHHTSPSSLPSSSSISTIPSVERRESARNTRPPLSSHFSVTDAGVKAFVFGNRQDRKRGHESPEAFLRPKSYRRGSEVPSLVSSLGSSEGSGLEDLEEEEEEEAEGEEVKDVGLVGKEVEWTELVPKVFDERFV